MNTMMSKFLPIVALSLSLTANAGKGQTECESVTNGLNCRGGSTSVGGGGEYSTAQIIQKAEQAGIIMGENEASLAPKCQNSTELCLKYVFMAIDIYTEVKNKKDSQSEQITSYMLSALRSGLTIYSSSLQAQLSRFDDKNIAFHPNLQSASLLVQRVVVAHAFLGTQGSDNNYELVKSLVQSK